MNFFNPIQNKLPYSFNQQTQIDPEKFQQGVQSLSKESLAQLVQRARAQGIPDSQIEAGLNYILNSK